MERHAKELHAAGRSRRAVEARVIERFIECGDPHYGFARIYCDACGHDYLLAYSYKTRYFCPSCHQKRVLLYADWVEENVLAPVAHRQYVFTVPKLLRPAFGRQRAWLGELCRLAARLLVEAYAEALPGACLRLLQCRPASRQPLFVIDGSKAHPCPTTSKITGRCPGHVKDHITPLAREANRKLGSGIWN